MSMTELRQEYELETIGEKILKIVHSLTWGVTEKYDPQIYGGAASWVEAHDDLVQTFALDVLIEQGQLAYAMNVADSEEHLKNLLARQLRFFLARNRRRTVIDNLLDRCKKLTGEPPFEQVVEKRSWSYFLGDRHPEDRRPNPDEIALIAGELLVPPVRVSSGSDRAPQIYSTEDLQRLLVQVASGLNCHVFVSDLDEIFRRLLTPWLPTFLGTDEGVMAVQDEPSLDAEQEAMAQQAATAIRHASNPIELGILAMKIANIPDSTIGRRFEMSRPTVIKHKKRVLKKVEAQLAGLSEACQSRTIELLGYANQEGHDEL